MDRLAAQDLARLHVREDMQKRAIDKQFQNPQWIARLRTYSHDDAFETVLWLHERLRGYPPIGVQE